MAKWDRIIAIRDAVNGALETARSEKKIGKSLEAKVALTVAAEDAFVAELDAEYLADLFIVSQVDVTVGGELAVAVAPAEGAKCERCWKNHIKVGSHAEHPGLCPRCAAVVAAIDPALLAE
jgi:isoleucyl-tRNA synthetase